MGTFCRKGRLLILAKEGSKGPPVESQG